MPMNDVAAGHGEARTTYQDDLEGITPDDLDGFFEGWPQRPSAQQFHQMLQRSSFVMLATEDDEVVGFISANSDGLNASIPLLEVRPEARGRGVGRALVTRMLDLLADHYAVDVVCDEDLVPFYEQFGLVPLRAMIRRSPDRIP